MITLIAAMDRNKLIGNNGKLPWKVPEDMNFFKTVTTNNIVVMGRKTYISIEQPLKNRVNVIISSSLVRNFDETKKIEDYESDVIVLREFVLDDYFLKSSKDIYIIGGRSIYKQALENSIPERLLLSKIDDEYEGNEFFPDIPKTYSFKQCFRISPRLMIEEWRINEVK